MPSNPQNEPDSPTESENLAIVADVLGRVGCPSHRRRPRRWCRYCFERTASQAGQARADAYAAKVTIAELRRRLDMKPGTLFVPPEIVVDAAAFEPVDARRRMEITDVDIVFDGPTGPEGPRFIETETVNGIGVGIGRWLVRRDGRNVLRIPVPASAVRFTPPKPELEPIMPIEQAEAILDDAAAELERRRGEIQRLTDLTAELQAELDRAEQRLAASVGEGVRLSRERDTAVRDAEQAILELQAELARTRAATEEMRREGGAQNARLVERADNSRAALHAAEQALLHMTYERDEALAERDVARNEVLQLASVLSTVEADRNAWMEAHRQLVDENVELRSRESTTSSALADALGELRVVAADRDAWTAAHNELQAELAKLQGGPLPREGDDRIDEEPGVGGVSLEAHLRQEDTGHGRPSGGQS